jgi:hypothetical protein
MASEITVTATLRVSKGGASIAPTKSKTFDMAGTFLTDNIQNLTAGNWEAIDFGDVATANYVYVHNLDATNFVELALDNASAQIFAKLLADQAAIFPAKTLTMYARANTGNCAVEFAACDL